MKVQGQVTLVRMNDFLTRARGIKMSTGPEIYTNIWVQKSARVITR